MPHVPLTPAQVEQLRRDAKRLRRETGLSHSEALNRLAAQQGYQNWSLLARSSLRDAVPAESEAQLRPLERQGRPLPRSSELHQALGLPRMAATRDELSLIRAIAERFAELLGAEVEVDRLGLMMDLEVCHCNGCPLDLIALLEAARDEDLGHDVAGIHRHLNRKTGKLEDCFWPRYALPAPTPAPAS